MGPRKKRWLAAVLTALVLIAATTGVVYAYLSANSGPVDNTFGADSDPQPTIVETFDGTTKSDVFVDVGNPGYAVYVRAAIVVTWEKADGSVYAQKPGAGTDYTIELNLDDWFLNSDGFYYHKAMVLSGADSSVLINSLTQTATAPDGYTLHVEIIAQTIQARGSTDANGTPAVTDAWGVSVDAEKNLISSSGT